MAIDDRERHQLYLKLEEILGSREADVLMRHLPPSGWADLVTKHDLSAAVEQVRSELRVEFERGFRRLVMWTTTTLVTGLLAGMVVAFAAGRYLPPG